MCVFVCVVCCIQTDVVKERERTEGERKRRRRRRRSSQQQRKEKRREEQQKRTTRRNVHRRPPDPEDRTDREMQHKRASRETWHNFSLSTFPIPASHAPRQQTTTTRKRKAKSEMETGRREKLYLTSTVSTTRPGNQPQRR